MPSINLEQKYKDEILAVLRKFLEGKVKFYIFGSRATGKALEYSDVDIAIDLEGAPIDSKIMSKLNFYFSENTLIPYTIDLIDLNSVSESFKNSIAGELIPFGG